MGAPLAPEGVSIFADSGDQRGDPAALCERLVRCGARAVYWWLWAIDGRSEDRVTAVALGRAALSFGIAPWFWYFPKPSRAREASEHADRVRQRIPEAGLVFDWEPPGVGDRWTSKAITAAVACRPEALTTVPSYMRSPFVDGEMAGIGVHLVQLERSANDAVLVERTIALARRPRRPEVQTQIVVGAFAITENAKRRLPNDPARLRGDIDRVLGPTDPPRFPGIAVYDLGSISADEGKVLLETSKRWPAPDCTTPRT